MPRKPASLQGDTLAQIRDAAFLLFGRYGYDGVSVGDIAQRTGLSKGALYWHFSGKRELFLDCLRRMHRIFEDIIFTPMLEQTDGVARTLVMFNGLSRLLQNPQVLDGVGGYWLGANTADLSRVADEQRDFELRTAAIIRQALALAVEQGAFTLADDLDDMSRAIIAIVEAIVLPLRNHDPEEVHRILAVLARTLFRAYATSDEVVALADNF